MKYDPILTKAIRLARKKKYDAAIKILETEYNRYYGKFTYYYLLGLSYLYREIWGVALRYLNLAVEQKLRDADTLCGLAALYLNRGDTDKAIDLYLEVQSVDKSNKIAKKALEIIRKNPGPENIKAWIESGRLRMLFPPFPRAAPPRITIAAGVLAALGIAILIAVQSGVFTMTSREIRPVPAEYALSSEERETPVQTGGSYRYVLTRDQVLNEYNEARRLFTEYRDDAARVRLNRILESNATDDIKNRARILIDNMAVPGFDTLKDRFTYNEVSGEPFLYRDCHVIWRGMASNLDIQDNHTSFDLLVGYDTYRTMEGIVQVTYNFAIPVNPERPVEILGRVIPVSAERDPRIRIQGIALNQAGLLDRSSQ